MKPDILKYVLNPLYWPAWVLVAITWCVALLPYRVLMCLGRGLGKLLYCLPTYSKKVAAINLQLCFPGLTDDERGRLLKKHYHSIGMAFFELLFAWWASDRRVKPLLKQTNVAVFKKVLAKGDGALAIIPHMMTLELVGRIGAMHYEMEAVYRPHRKPLIDLLNRWHLSRSFNRAIPRHDVRAMVRCMKRGQTVLLLPDIDAGKERAVFSPFFGVPAATVDSVGRIAGMAGAPVMPFGIYRLEDGSGYELEFFDPIDNLPSGNVQSDVDRINLAFETIIRKYPEQYLWTYRRFYTRPVGSKRVYPSKRTRR